MSFCNFFKLSCFLSLTKTTINLNSPQDFRLNCKQTAFPIFSSPSSSSSILTWLWFCWFEHVILFICPQSQRFCCHGTSPSVELTESSWRIGSQPSDCWILTSKSLWAGTGLWTTCTHNSPKRLYWLTSSPHHCCPSLNHCIVTIHFSCDCAFNVQTGLLGSTSQWLKPPRELSVRQSYQFNYILCWVHNLFFKLGTIADWTTPPWKVMRAKDCSGLSHKKLWHSWADLNVTAVSLFHSVFCLWCLYVLLCYMPIYFAVYS